MPLKLVLLFALSFHGVSSIKVGAARRNASRWYRDGKMEAVAKALRAVLNFFRKILKKKPQITYTLILKEIAMATSPPPLNQLYRGFGATLLAQILANGYPYRPAAGSTLPAVTWKADDPSAVIEALDGQTATVSIPASDTVGSVTVTASCTAPDGTPLEATFVLAVSNEPVVYTLQITQTGFTG